VARARGGPALQGLLAFITFLVTFVITAGMPLVSHLNVPNLRQYWTDEQFYAWSLGWWPYAVGHGVNPLFSNQIGAPHGYELAAGLVIGFAVAGRAARRAVVRLGGLAAIAYIGAVILSVPYLIYSLKHYQGALTRQQPAYSLPLVRLVLPRSQQMFGVASLIKYSNHVGDGGIEDYVGIPLIVVLLALAVFGRRNRLSRLLLIGFVFVTALAAGPNLVVTSVGRRRDHLPDGPLARSTGAPGGCSPREAGRLAFDVAGLNGRRPWVAAVRNSGSGVSGKELPSD
jgi:hypothetical protein